MNKALNNLKIDLENIFKDKLVSVILYGSAVTENYNPKFSDINLIVIIEDLVASDLKIACKSVKKWIKAKHSAPLFIDRQEWFDSNDVYAVEYSDIKERYKIIYGDNLVELLEIDAKDIRLQCESEIKHLLVKLRQNYLLYNKDKNLMKEMLKATSRSIIAIFRAILRLMGQKVPYDHKEVVNNLAEKINFDNNILIDILLFREKKKRFSSRELEHNVQELIDLLEQILKYIDKFEVTGD